MKRRFILVTLLVFALSMMVGVVSAQETEDDNTRRQAVRVAVGQVVQVVTEQTDLTAQSVFQQLRDGSTMAEIIEAAGGDLDTITAEIEAQLVTLIETAEENGRITEEQVATLIENLPETIDTVLNTVPDLDNRRPNGDRVRGQVLAVLVQAVMDETGLTLPEALEAISGEATVAEVIEANGGSTEAVVNAVITNVTLEANERVAEGDITQAQADRIIEGLDEVLTNWLNGDFEFDIEGRRGNRGQGNN